jgi:hypothetical protein
MRGAGGKQFREIKIGALGIIFIALSTTIFAQDLSQHNWYFGSTTSGIRFNRGTNVAQSVNNQAIPFGRGGSAVATDPATANLLFYTDGVQVYDACHLPCLMETDLRGNPMRINLQRLLLCQDKPIAGIFLLTHQILQPVD